MAWTGFHEKLSFFFFIDVKDYYESNVNAVCVFQPQWNKSLLCVTDNFSGSI